MTKKKGMGDKPFIGAHDEIRTCTPRTTTSKRLLNQFQKKQVVPFRLSTFLHLISFFLPFIRNPVVERS
jgi:hypothetical protein